MVSKKAASVMMLVSVAVAIIAACSSKSSGGGGGGGNDGGTSSAGLLANPGVTQTCQTCLAGASGNDCSAQAKTCTSDSNCVGLNGCVNKCTNLNSGCITNCSNAASVNAGTEWSGWFDCACNDCMSQCSACAGGSSSGGSSGGGSGSSSGGSTITCTVDAQVQASCTSGTGYYCTGPDNPQGDGLSSACSSPVADPSGVGTDYCCN